MQAALVGNHCKASFVRRFVVRELVGLRRRLIPLFEIFHGVDMNTAKVFWSGRSQAVRLPKAFRFEAERSASGGTAGR